MWPSRYLADRVASRRKGFYGDSASRNINVARVLAYAGYSYELLAENLCTIPVNGSVPYTPEELTKQFTIPRLNEAITVATAAKAATSVAAVQASADSLISISRVRRAMSSLYEHVKATGE